MSSRIRITATLASALVLQATILSEVRIDGASVELMLLVAVLAGFHGGPERGALVAFSAGLLHDTIVPTPLGLHALVFPPLAVAVSSLEQRMLRSMPFTDALAVAVACAGGMLLVASVGRLFGLATLDPEVLTVRVPTAAVMTTVVALPVNRAVRWAVTGGLPPELRLRTAEG